jgi:hypothetical protein
MSGRGGNKEERSSRSEHKKEYDKREETEEEDMDVEEMGHDKGRARSSGQQNDGNNGRNGAVEKDLEKKKTTSGLVADETMLSFASALHRIEIECRFVISAIRQLDVFYSSELPPPLKIRRDVGENEETVFYDETTLPNIICVLNLLKPLFESDSAKNCIYFAKQFQVSIRQIGLYGKKTDEEETEEDSFTRIWETLCIWNKRNISREEQQGKNKLNYVSPHFQMQMSSLVTDIVHVRGIEESSTRALRKMITAKTPEVLKEFEKGDDSRNIKNSLIVVGILASIFKDKQSSFFSKKEYRQERVWEICQHYLSYENPDAKAKVKAKSEDDRVHSKGKKRKAQEKESDSEDELSPRKKKRSEDHKSKTPDLLARLEKGRSKEDTNAAHESDDEEMDEDSPGKDKRDKKKSKSKNEDNSDAEDTDDNKTKTKKKDSSSAKKKESKKKKKSSKSDEEEEEEQEWENPTSHLNKDGHPIFLICWCCAPLADQERKSHEFLNPSRLAYKNPYIFKSNAKESKKIFTHSKCAQEMNFIYTGLRVDSLLKKKNNTNEDNDDEQPKKPIDVPIYLPVPFKCPCNGKARFLGNKPARDKSGAIKPFDRFPHDVDSRHVNTCKSMRACKENASKIFWSMWMDDDDSWKFLYDNFEISKPQWITNSKKYICIFCPKDDRKSFDKFGELLDHLDLFGKDSDDLSSGVGCKTRMVKAFNKSRLIMDLFEFTFFKENRAICKEIIAKLFDKQFGSEKTFNSTYPKPKIGELCPKDIFEDPDTDWHRSLKWWFKDDMSSSAQNESNNTDEDNEKTKKKNGKNKDIDKSNKTNDEESNEKDDYDRGWKDPRRLVQFELNAFLEEIQKWKLKIFTNAEGDRKSFKFEIKDCCKYADLSTGALTTLCYSEAEEEKEKEENKDRSKNDEKDSKSKEIEAKQKPDNETNNKRKTVLDVLPKEEEEEDVFEKESLDDKNEIEDEKTNRKEERNAIEHDDEGEEREKMVISAADRKRAILKNIEDDKKKDHKNIESQKNTRINSKTTEDTDISPTDIVKSPKKDSPLQKNKKTDEENPSSTREDHQEKVSSSRKGSIFVDEESSHSRPDIKVNTEKKKQVEEMDIVPEKSSSSPLKKESANVVTKLADRMARVNALQPNKDRSSLLEEVVHNINSSKPEVRHQQDKKDNTEEKNKPKTLQKGEDDTNREKTSPPQRPSNSRLVLNPINLGKKNREERPPASQNQEEYFS